MSLSSTLHPTCNAQLTTSGLGTHFVSPGKARDKRKMQTLVELPGARAKCHRLLAEIEELMKPQCEKPNLQATSPQASHNNTAEHIQSTDDASVLSFDDVDMVEGPSLDIPAVDMPVKRRIVPDKSITSLYSNWSTFIPALITPLLCYFGRTQGKALENIQPVISACAGKHSCIFKRTTLICLFFDRKCDFFYHRRLVLILV